MVGKFEFENIDFYILSSNAEKDTGSFLAQKSLEFFRRVIDYFGP